MRVGFYLPNRKIPNADLRFPEQGNPGCGGTEYMIATIPYFIAQITGHDIEPILFSAVPGKLPNDIQVHTSGNLIQGITDAKQMHCSYFVYKPSQSKYQEILNVINEVEGSDLAILALFQLTPNNKILNSISQSRNFRAVICVEHEQIDSIRDHPVFAKAVVIPNGISLLPYEKFRPIYPFHKREKKAIYLGSLTPQKGFGRLARAWPHVTAAVPDAELLVVGSGKLYNENETLGSWGVASENFEKKHIRPFLSKEDGSPISSVRFLGVLGMEKLEYLAKSMVGIVNPIGYTETFCISAIEIQAAGTPVIAGAYGGLFDTIKHGTTGYLIKNQRQLVVRLIELLSDKSKAEIMGRQAIEFVENTYDLTNIAKQWVRFLGSLALNQGIFPPPPKREITSWDKYLIRLNAKLKAYLGSPDWWPSILMLAEKVNRLRKKAKLLR